MNWNIKKHRIGSGQQELQVSIVAQELSETYAWDAESWLSAFKDRISNIRRTNNFSAEYSCQGVIINPTTLEVWKSKANGDLNYKMLTVTRE